jgi:serine/threonine-protein kinase HipA
MSMSLRGEKANYYNWDSIQPRHFISTAKAVNFSEAKASAVLEEMLTKVVRIQVRKGMREMEEGSIKA